MFETMFETRLMRLLYRLLLRSYFGSFRESEINGRATIRAHHLGVLISHFVEEGGKGLAAVIAPNINRFVASFRACHSGTSSHPPPRISCTLFYVQSILMEKCGRSGFDRLMTRISKVGQSFSGASLCNNWLVTLGMFKAMGLAATWARCNP